MAYQEGQLPLQMAVDVVLSGLTPGTPIASSFAVDLNENFGQGHSPRKSPYLGQTGKLMVRVDVTQDFTVLQGIPHLQFHLLGSKVSLGFIHSGAEYVFLGSNVGPTGLNGAQVVNGFVAEDLTEGQSFWVRINPWNDKMGRTASDPVAAGGAFVVGEWYRILTLGTTDWYAIGGEPVVGSRFQATGAGAGTGTAQQITLVQDLRYFGLAISVPDAAGGGGDPAFAQGSVIGKFVYDDQPEFEPADMIYPSGVVNK